MPPARDFPARYAGTSHSIGVAVLAGEGTAMERDYDHASARHAADLEAAEAVGRRAGERAVARLNPRKVKSQAVPVVFDPRVAARPGRPFRGRDFGRVDRPRRELPEGPHGTGRCSRRRITIIDDPHRLRGLRSKPFDGEGVANRRWR